VRRRAEQKARAQLERLNLLHQITRAVGERQDLNSIFQVVVRSLEDELPVDFACLCLYDRIDHALTVASVGVKSGGLALDLALPERARVDNRRERLGAVRARASRLRAGYWRGRFSVSRRLARVGLRSLVMAPLQVEKPNLRRPRRFPPPGAQLQQRRVRVPAAIERAPSPSPRTKRSSMRRCSRLTTICTRRNRP